MNGDRERIRAWRRFEESKEKFAEATGGNREDIPTELRDYVVPLEPDVFWFEGEFEDKSEEEAWESTCDCCGIEWEILPDGKAKVIGPV